MLKIKVYVAFAALAFCQTFLGQERIIKIPFELTEHNNISIQAILNTKDTVHLMLHSAANAVSITEDATKRCKSLNFSSSANGVKSWGGESNTSRQSENNTLQIGKMVFDTISIWENKFSGPKTDGKLGLELFKDKVLQLDFDNKILTVSSELPNDIQDYQKLKLRFENDMLFLEARLTINAKVLKHDFLIHSGYSGDILLDDQFANDQKIEENIKIIGTKELKDAYGNIIKTMQAILPDFQVGDVKLTEVPVGFFSGAIGRQKMSVIGGDIIKRFNIIIDANRAYIYFKPNQLLHDAYVKN